jgi:hypothetical protein
LALDWLDPYRWVVQCVAGRQPAAHQFIEQTWKVGA